MIKDPCTIALELDKELMEIHTNPYVENLVEMGTIVLTVKQYSRRS